ncbi:activating transcription factor 3 [Culicoides brevitarsis]|uniref:activating transcription factor 3 n=1 Tax=Culicoides brevitarsis TaxID=469753 RepID=UPI00307C9B10
MYTFNGGLSAPPLLSIDSGGGGGNNNNNSNNANDQNNLCVAGSNIPRTPEILNSLIAMTNPLEYSYPSNPSAASSDCSPSNNNVSTSNQNGQMQFDSHSSCSTSPLDSPAGSTATPSVAKTCSQLIKAGIKLHIQNKRKYSGCESSGNESSVVTTATQRYSRKRADTTTDNMTSDDDLSNHGKSPRIGLTPEDEDRRRRRRERNKIAATKCRMKKRERTVNLVNESETLETQNIDFKNQIRELENQRRKLNEILQAHSPHCVHQGGYQPLPSVSTLKNCKYLNELQNFCDQNQQIPLHQQQQQPQQQQQMHQSVIEQPEIKYSQMLKEQQETLEYGDYKNNTMLPHGYCKPSPTDTTYVLSPDSGFVKSPVDLDNNSQYSDQLSSMQLPHSCQQQSQQQQQQQQQQPGHLKSNNYNIPTSNDAILTNNNSSSLNNNLNNLLGDTSEIYLKTELMDPSPYTTIQSADRFLFEGTDTTFGDNTTNGVGNNHLNTPNNVHNLLMDSFDTSIIKADFLSHNQEFNIGSMVDGSDTQFTDLDSGIIKSLSNGCLV